MIFHFKVIFTITNERRARIKLYEFESDLMINFVFSLLIIGADYLLLLSLQAKELAHKNFAITNLNK